MPISVSISGWESVEEVISNKICRFYEHMVSGENTNTTNTTNTTSAQRTPRTPTTYSVVPLCNLIIMLSTNTNTNTNTNSNNTHSIISTRIIIQLQTCITQYITVLSMGSHLVETQYELLVELCFKYMEIG